MIHTKQYTKETLEFIARKGLFKIRLYVNTMSEVHDMIAFCRDICIGDAAGKFTSTDHKNRQVPIDWYFTDLNDFAAFKLKYG